MHISFMQLCGIWSIALGCYALLAVVFPRMRPCGWRMHSKTLFVMGTSFCFLLGLWAFGIGRPYTFIAALLVWAIGFLVQRFSAKPVPVRHERENR
jgi:hypothetical protein